MSSTKDTPSFSETNNELFIGRVKWFNNKAGYGFITITQGEKSDSDVFVHHSAINVENQQYKYLVQGEYVQFKLSSTQGGNHEFQASDVSGINHGKLMCETRREFKIARSNYRKPEDEEEFKLSSTQVIPREEVPRQVRPRPRVRGEGPRDAQQKDWTTVKKREPNSQRSRPVVSEKA
jgi:cold shock CspA family protein